MPPQNVPPIDPRYVQVTPTIPGQGLTPPRLMTPEEQRTAVTTLLNDLYRAQLDEDDPMYLAIPQPRLDFYREHIDAWSYYVPNLVLNVTNDLDQQYGYSLQDPNREIDPGLGAVVNEILSTAETRSETIRTDTTSQVTVDREGATERERETQVTETRFVDLPTAEEFMNDFRVGFASYTQELRSQGLITSETANWMAVNPDIFYDRYLADLARRAEAGEDIFQVVGASQDPHTVGPQVYIGDRPGGQEILETTGIDRERIYQEVVNNERSQIEEEVIRDLTSTGTVETTEQQQQVDAEVDRRLNERTNTLINEAIEYFGTESTITTEQVFARPNLTAVFRISPKDFLTSALTPHSVTQLAAGRGARAEAVARAPRGDIPSAPRRVGGV